MNFWTNLPTAEEEKAHLLWLSNLIAMVRQGGAWAIPRSQVVITFDHENKTVTFSGKGEDLTEYYFKQLGWKVKHA